MLLFLLSACSDYKLNEDKDAVAGAQPDIEVSPTALDFGTIEVGCTVQLPLNISNVGEASLDVASITIGDAADFQLTGVEPFALLPDEHRTVYVDFTPMVEGRVNTSVDVGSNDPDEPTVDVPNAGTGLSTRTVDRYVQRTPEVDVLWMIDNSGSMAEEQARVIASISSFFAYFETLGLDYHMGVVTTDIVTPTMAGQLQGSPAYITPTTPNGEVELAEAINVGTEDMGDESGLAALKLALTDPVLSTTNTGFLRDEAQLVIVFLTDEPEQSGVPSSDYIAWLSTLKADPSYINVSSIVGDYDVGCKTTCDGAPSTAQPGNAYVDVAAAFPGVFGSICACDLSTVLADVGLDGTLFTRIFRLTSTPADPASIAIEVDGVPLTSGWAYDATLNAVVFDLPPPSDILIDIQYDTVPGCG